MSTNKKTCYFSGVPAFAVLFGRIMTFWDLGSNLPRFQYPQTRFNSLDRITRLYEQGADSKRIGQYIKNWNR